MLLYSFLVWIHGYIIIFVMTRKFDFIGLCNRTYDVIRVEGHLYRDRVHVNQVLYNIIHSEKVL